MAASTDARKVGVMGAWVRSVGVYFWPGSAGRLWAEVTVGRAAVVAGIHFLLAVAWLWVVVVCEDAWGRHRLRVGTYLGGYVSDPGRVFWRLFGTVPRQFWDSWLGLNLLDKWGLVFGVAVLLVTFLAILFFLLLPFAARPGGNKACVKHVLRTVMMGTGFVHVVMAATAGMFLWFVVERYPPELEDVIRPVLVVFCGLTLWGFAVLVLAVRGEYRRAEDYPQARDPTCDECGYDLVAAEFGGRCPECGKLVAESLGPEVRKPTEWERRPVVGNLGVIVRQVGKLVFRPRGLFSSMPTLTGQGAAQRWLVGVMVMIACEAFFIIPAFSITGMLDIDWANRVVGGMAVAMVWGLLGLMMVGIETAGIATFSRMKGRPVTLGTAAKVTGYSATLMLPWVILGGAQLLGMEWWNEHFARHYSVRIQQIVFTGSLAAAHIGGLLWYEFTVYRGIRSVQFANQ